MDQDTIDLLIIRPITTLVYLIGTIVLVRLSKEQIIRSIALGLAVVGLLFEVVHLLTIFNYVKTTDDEMAQTYYTWGYFALAAAMIDLRMIYGIWKCRERNPTS